MSDYNQVREQIAGLVDRIALNELSDPTGAIMAVVAPLLAERDAAQGDGQGEESSNGAFYMSMECESCDEDILMGPCLTTIEHNGYPVIPFDMAAQERFACDCGAKYYTGDFDVFSEDEL